jgi:hypothetical protein
MKKILLIAILCIAIFSCATEIEEPVDINVIEKYMTYCDEVVYTGASWADTANVWRSLKLTDTQSLVEIELVHTGGDTTESIYCSFRKDSLHNVFYTNASFESSNGSVLMSTDANGYIQFKNEWAAEEARKIFFTLKLKMY